MGQAGTPDDTAATMQDVRCDRGTRGAVKRSIEASAQPGRDPAMVRGDASLATVLRKAQWMLDDAAFYLPEGRCSREDCELLAKTLEQIAVLVRERATRSVVIDPSAE